MESRKSHQLQIRVTPGQKERIRRLAEASGQGISGYVVSRVLPASGERFAELVHLLGREGEDRYVLAELNDLLASLGAEELRQAVEYGHLEGLSPFLRNYVAAMVEQACQQKGIPPPGWTSTVPPLESPHFAVPFEGLRLHLLRASPVPFKRRNIFVDSSVGARV